jgi:hypothetical protein
MDDIKEYFKNIPNNVSTYQYIVKSDDILFTDKTDETDIELITKLLSNFMTSFNKKYRTMNIPVTRARADASTYLQSDNVDWNEFNEPTKPIRIPTSTNKTRKNRDGTLIKQPVSDDTETTEYIPPETEYNEEEYQLVTDIIASKNAVDMDYTVIPETKYFLNNRVVFTKFLEKMFGDYAEHLKDAIVPGCDTIQSNDKISLLIHQKLISDYLNLNTPYRGLLLFHGLGSGKTCSSIAISEQFKNTNKRVFILTPASLAPNYEKELKKCGNIIFKLNNNWKWIPYEHISSQSTTLETEMYLPKGFIKKHGGVWVIWKSKDRTEDNIAVHNETKKNKITFQIEQMLSTKYTFIHYNGITKAFVKKFTKDYTENPFDNSVIIIDEVHKLVNAIVNNLKKIPKNKGVDDYKEYSTSLQLYSYIMKSKFSRVVLLTGTPLVNSPNEIAIIYNMIHGLIRTIECILTINTTAKLTTETLIKYLNTEGIFKYINYINYEPSTKKLIIVRNEDGFVTSDTPGLGVSYDASVTITTTEFNSQLKRALAKYSIITGTFEERDYKHLPESYDDFTNRFYQNRKLINVNQLKSRIYGLTSYYSGTPELLPLYNKKEDYIQVPVPMSQYQFGTYIKAREVEQQSEKNKMSLTGKDVFKEQSSTYRINSRLACNFVIPDALLPSTKKKTTEPDDSIYKTFDSDYLETVDEDTDLSKNVGMLREELDSPRYLSMDALLQFGPKLHAIIQQLNNPENIGLHLVYSQFRHLHGLEILGMAMKENGFAEFKIQNTSTGWKLDISKEDLAKPKFAFYTGKETAVLKEILLNIYNGFLDNIPIELSTSLKALSLNNNYGELIKVFMITASGAEGLDLKNTRYVHIMEPYWNMVRIEQVIGRAVRICSHKNLDPQYRNVKAFIYLAMLPQDQIDKKNPNQIMMRDTSRLFANKPISTDQFINETAIIKEDVMSQLVTVIKETSMDCRVYPNNKKEKLACYTPMAIDNKHIYTYEPNYKSETHKSIK